MSSFYFDQKAFVKEIFEFIYTNMTIREFCKRAGCSAATLYRAKRGEVDAPMDLKTIRAFERVVKETLPTIR